MDGNHFDLLAKTMATTPIRSRRHALRIIWGHALAGAGLGALVVPGRGNALAAGCLRTREICAADADCCPGSTCEGDGRCGRRGEPTGGCRCRCERGLKECNGRCRDFKTDERNCGGCGATDPAFVCEPDQGCIYGTCTNKGNCTGAEFECESAPGVGTGTCCHPYDAPCCAGTYTTADGTNDEPYYGCQCRDALNRRGCQVGGTCCAYGFSESGVCYCAPPDYGCSQMRGCTVGGACDYCCSGTCDAVDGFTGGRCR